MNDGTKCPHGCGQTLVELARGAPHAIGCPSTGTAKLRAEITDAWKALGVDPREAADDPDTARLADSIRVSLQHERDERERLRERYELHDAINRPRLGVVPLVAVGERIVLGKRRNGVHAGKWILPGGGVEFRERLHDAGVREYLEETGMRIEIRDDENPITVMQIIGRETHRVCLVMPAKALDPLDVLRPSDELIEVRGFTFEELSTVAAELTPPVHDCLERLGFLRKPIATVVAPNAPDDGPGNLAVGYDGDDPYDACISCAEQPDDERCPKTV